MVRLKNRNAGIPNGLRFLQPETNWKPRPHSSFTGIVQALIQHRKGNPALKNKYPTDLRAVEDEVDAFNAKLAQKMGWTDYITESAGGAPRTFFHPSPGLPRPPIQRTLAPAKDPNVLSAVGEKIKKIWSGVKTIDQWLDSGISGVESSLSESRAAVCAACPKNTKGDFTSWFTAPAAAAIKRQIEKAQSKKFTTPHDEKLNVCDICLCPMKLKVHTPINFIQENMSPEVLAELKAVPNCWIPKEL